MKLSPTAILARRFYCWRRRNISPQIFGCLLAVTVGAGAGVAAHTLKWCIARLSEMLTAHMRFGGPNYEFLVLPLAGIVLTFVFTRYVLHRDLEDGTERLTATLKSRRTRLPFRFIFTPIIANTLTLGFGGSAGSEGPSAVSAAAIASNIGRWCLLSRQEVALVTACGAGAGIAGIFTAPVGGIFFVFECIHIPMTLAAVLSLSLSCLTAGATAFYLAHSTFDVSFPPGMIFDMSHMGIILLLGLFCGLYSWYYCRTGIITRRLIRRVSSPWARALLSGALVSLLVFLFPTLYGEGYNAITAIVNDAPARIGDYSFFHGLTSSPWALVALVAAIAAVKAVASYGTNSGGGVAGDFAPALFAGCMAGLLFGMLVNGIFGTAFPTAHLALVAMSAVLAGVVRAPLMAIFIAMETTDSFGFLLPVTVATAISFLTVRFISRLCRR